MLMKGEKTIGIMNNNFKTIWFSNIRASLGAMVRLLPCDLKVTGSDSSQLVWLVLHTTTLSKPY